jgi:hypothetical protein
MPIQLEIFHPDRIVLGVGRGDITTAEYAKFLADIIQAGVIHYRKIIDVTSAISSSLGAEQLIAFDTRLRETGDDRRGPLAIVADPTRNSGIAQVFKAMTSPGRPVEVFRSIHDARKWLARQPIRE